MTKRKKAQRRQAHGKGLRAQTLADWLSGFIGYSKHMQRRRTLADERDRLTFRLNEVMADIEAADAEAPNMRTRVARIERELMETVHPLGGIFIVNDCVVKVTPTEVGLVGTLNRAVKPEGVSNEKEEASAEADTVLRPRA